MYLSRVYKLHRERFKSPLQSRRNRRRQLERQVDEVRGTSLFNSFSSCSRTTVMNRVRAIRLSREHGGNPRDTLVTRDSKLKTHSTSLEILEETAKFSARELLSARNDASILCTFVTARRYANSRSRVFVPRVYTLARKRVWLCA